MRIFPKGWPWKKNIEDLDSPGDVYLERTMWFKTKRFGIYIHRIYRADYARCEHDHPWPFLTVILRGGYEEEINGKLYVRKPGYIGWRPRRFQHRITRLLKGPAVTLFIRGFNYERWNFYNGKGKRPIDWQDYVLLPGHMRVAWCDDTLADE